MNLNNNDNNILKSNEINNELKSFNTTTSWQSRTIDKANLEDTRLPMTIITGNNITTYHCFCFSF